MTKTIQCKCDHAFQDAEHGKGMRVHNVSEDNKKAKCTVCGVIKTLGSFDKETKTQVKK